MRNFNFENNENFKHKQINILSNNTSTINFRGKNGTKFVKEISDETLKLASAGISAIGLASINLSSTIDSTKNEDSTKVLENLNESKEYAKENLKKYLSRDAYIRARETFNKTDNDINYFLENLLIKTLKNWNELDTTRQQFVKQIAYQVLSERISDSEKPKDFSDIPNLKQHEQRTKFMNLFFSKEIFENFINKGMNTIDIRQLLLAGHGTISLRLSEYNLKTELTTLRQELASPEIDRKILELHAKGLNQAEIAREIGLKINIIQTAFKRLNIKSQQQERIAHNNSTENIAKILQLREEGKTLEEIAKLVGTSRTSVSEILSRNGEQNRNAQINSEIFIKKVKELYEKGYNLTQISEELGCSDDHVSKILKKEGMLTPLQLKRKAFAEKRPLVINMYLTETKDLNKIAEKYELTWQQIYQILDKANVLEKKYPQQNEDDQKVLDLFAQNLQINDIAERLGKSVSYVYKVLERHGKKTDTAIRKEQMAQESFKQNIIEHFKAGYSVSEISQLTNCDSRTVRNILNENGYKTDEQVHLEYIHSKELREEIVEQFNANIPIYIIAKNTNTNPVFITKILQKINLLSKNQESRRLMKSKEIENKLKMLYAKGYSIKQCAEIYGVSISSIERKLKEMGLLSRRQQYTERLSKTLAPIINERLEANQSYEDIANELGISLLRLYLIIRTYTPVKLPDINYEEFTDKELIAKMNNLFFENEILFNDKNLTDIFDFIESYSSFTPEQRTSIINLIKDCEKLIAKKTSPEEIKQSETINKITTWMKEAQEAEDLKIDEYENLISDLNNILINSKSEIINQYIIKYMPYSYNDKNINKAKIIRDLINESPDYKTAEYKLTYIEEKESNSEVCKFAEQYALNSNNEVDVLKAGQFIICYQLLQDLKNDKNIEIYPKEILDIIKNARISDKYKVEYIISLDNWLNLDDNEKSKLSVFKTIFNQNTDISKEITEKYLADIYQNLDTKYVATGDNGRKENVVLAANAKKGIINKYKIGKNSIDLILKFENAMTRFAGPSGESGIKYLDNLGYHEVKIPRPHIDRLAPSAKDGFYFDEYLPRGLHQG